MGSALGSRDPGDVGAYDELLSRVTVGVPETLSEPIRVCDYDARWPEAFEREAARVCARLVAPVGGSVGGPVGGSDDSVGRAGGIGRRSPR